MSPFLVAAVFGLLAWFNQAPPPALPLADRFVLLPDEEGKVGRVVVKTATEEQTLTSAYAGAEVSAGRITPRQEDAASIAQRFGQALSARPPKPVAYTVYFASGDQLAPESMQVIEQLKAELSRRAVPEVTVIGHTDRVGKLEANDALSIKRAERVRALLLELGVSAKAIETAGRGEREPLVPTADEVAEARNRRVEISVR